MKKNEENLFDEMNIEEVLFQKTTKLNSGKESTVDISLTITNLLKMGESSASLEYQYLAKYPGIGYLKIKGNLVLRKINASKLEKAWKTGKILGSFPEIMNTIYYFVSPVAITLSTSLGLPPASLPLIMPQQKTKTTRKAKA